ncbi:unnamed protein product [Rhizophagus irregularis]|uniref:Uncharacterized protein n=1 Tax=Rhizophagus irregularis TaxID=588596 RepID=A0A915ZU72_9GLOM|nr:unnamed protein product [Rhizophagus irregularis]CAB5387329.1 unnamed protein product [Rhizophagus irregularis]
MPPRTRNNSRIQEKAKKAETLQSTIIGVEGSQKKQKRSYTSRQKEAAIQPSDVYTIIDVEEPLIQQLEDSITLKESNALIDFLNETNDYLSANTRIGVDEIDDDEEAVSNLVKLHDKKATKNVSGAVAGLNTNSTPVLTASSVLTPQSDDKLQNIKSGNKGKRVTLNDLEIEDFIDEAVANKVFSRFLAATNRRLFNENGNMEILVGLLQSSFKASFNKRDIKAIKALDAITCNMQVFSKSGCNIAMNLELY